MADDAYPIPLSALMRAVMGRIAPQPAGDYPPSLTRAIQHVRAAYPDDTDWVRSADIGAQPYAAFEPYVDGTTDFGNQVRISPESLALRPQPWIDKTLAHELQHVRQKNPNTDPWAYARQFDIPYSERPTELDASRVANRYEDTHGGPPREGWTQAALRSFLGDIFRSR